MSSIRSLFVLSLLSLGQTCASPAEIPPYTVAPELFDQQAADLGLQPVAGARTVTIFRASEATDRYCNGAALIEFKGRFFAQWQSSARDEDSPDTWVAYSTSIDGENWSPPQRLSPRSENSPMHSSGGWWTDGETLVAYLNVWPSGFASGAGGYTVCRTSRDGANWSEPQPVLDAAGHPVAGIIEQDIHRYGARLHTAFHLAPGLIAQPHYTDDPLGLRGWTRGAMPHLPHPGTTSPSRELEPSLYKRSDGALVMVFRDQASTYRQLAAVSTDDGASWTQPVLTDMPDARAKQSAGNLPDGTAFLVNCPRAGRERVSLAVTLSRDGRVFTRSVLLRGAADLPALRYPGRAKRTGYHYPKSLVARDGLYVIYATNKEDVQLTRVPLKELTAADIPPVPH